MAHAAAPAYLAFMADFFSILLPAMFVIVFGVLCFGIYTLFRGGDFGRSWSNKAMRMRVLVQFIAVIILAGALWWKQTHG